LSVIAGARFAQFAAAQDDEIVLTAEASAVGASPGAAFAEGYAAVATADQEAGATTLAATSPPPPVATTPAAEEVAAIEEELATRNKGP
jgi:hypothetical protein